MAQSTSEQRVNWRAFECQQSQLKRIIFGPCELLVAPPTVDAWKALACVLAANSYQIRAANTSSYNCRAITGGSGPSLHSYGIAVDVNDNTNPYIKTPDGRLVRFSNKVSQSERAQDVHATLADTDMTPAIISDVEAIKTTGGVQVFEWGGRWTSIKDPMHFELDVSPSELAAGIDWKSVKGANGEAPVSIAWPQPQQPLAPPVVTFAGELGVFEKCMPVIEKWEGNFDNDPDDPGGPTNMGITQADLARWRQHPVSVDDVRNLTRDEARQIFKAFYWSPIKGDQLPLPIAQMCMDSAVLRGTGRAAMDMQQALNRQNANLAVDGVVGPNTISASLRSDTKKFVSDFAAIAEAYLRSRPGFPKYGKGWLNRLNDVREVAAAMASALPQQQSSGGGKMPTSVDNIVSVLQQALTVLQAVQKAQTPTTAPPTSPTAPSQQQSQTSASIDIQKILDLINGLISGTPALGQVNGAFGQTIGDLLNGKKTAIGTIGALATSILSIPGISNAVTSVLPTALASAPIAGVAWPVFLALTGWGVLGKMEKWSQGTAPPPKP